MQGIQESNLVAAVSKMAQTDYLTAVAPAAGAYIEQVMTARNFIKKGVPTQNNKGQTTGNRFATESWVAGGHTTDFSMPFDGSFQNIGRYLYAAMGVCASSAQATLRRHLLGLLNTNISAQLPAYTIIEQAAPGNNGLNVKAPSMVAKSLKLSGDGTAKCSGTVDWVGSGEYVQPSGVTWGTDVTSTQGTQVPIYNTTAALTRSEAATNANPVYRSMCENLGWEINVNNSFADNDYGCARLADPTDAAKGVLRSHLLLTDTEITSKFKFKLPQSSTEMSLLENQAPLALSLKLISTQTLVATTQSLAFIMPLNKYKVLDHTAENGFIYLTVEPETLYSVADAQAMSAELINNVTNY